MIEIRGSQLRRLKDLLPEENQEKFKKIFQTAFNKEDVTPQCEVKISKSHSWAFITIHHDNRQIATIDVRDDEPTIAGMNENYIFEIHSSNQYFRVYKLND